MPNQRNRLIAAGVLLGLTALACGQLSPPESCGENIGGTADEAKFDELFAEMTLVDGASGEPGSGDPPTLAAGDQLIIQAQALDDVSVRACIEESRGGGEIALDEIQTMAAGESSFSIGTFEPGPYVIRVIVDDTLIKNLPFTVE